MLNEKDIELLAGVFLTKDDLQKLASKEDVTFLHSEFNSAKERQQNFEEKIEIRLTEIKKDTEGIASLREVLQEFIVTNDSRITKTIERLDKQEEWIKLLAGKLGLSLQ